MSALLSDREREVVTWLYTPLSQKEIADRLHISERTVKHHCRAIYVKLGIADRIELMANKIREFQLEKVTV